MARQISAAQVWNRNGYQVRFDASLNAVIEGKGEKHEYPGDGISTSKQIQAYTAAQCGLTTDYFTYFDVSGVYPDGSAAKRMGIKVTTSAYVADVEAMRAVVALRGGEPTDCAKCWRGVFEGTAEDLFDIVDGIPVPKKFADATEYYFCAVLDYFAACAFKAVNPDVKEEACGTKKLLWGGRYPGGAEELSPPVKYARLPHIKLEFDTAEPLVVHPALPRPVMPAECSSAPSSSSSRHSGPEPTTDTRMDKLCELSYNSELFFKNVRRPQFVEFFRGLRKPVRIAHLDQLKAWLADNDGAITLPDYCMKIKSMTSNFALQAYLVQQLDQLCDVDTEGVITSRQGSSEFEFDF